MARITVEDCIDKVDGPYDLVLIAKERAVQLNSGEQPNVDPENDKNTVIALKEIAENKVSVDELKESAINKLRKHIEQDTDLSGVTNGDIYINVGDAMRSLNVVGQSRSFSSIGKGLFGTDVLLACVYAVYMYTVFKVKLSQEFNRILPELPELTQRVLGVHNMEKN